MNLPGFIATLVPTWNSTHTATSSVFLVVWHELTRPALTAAKQVNCPLPIVD